MTLIADHTTPITIVILGAGRGGTSFLELLRHLRGVRIAGIADKRLDAPGLQRAADLNIPISYDLEPLIEAPDINLILDVTGDPSVEHVIRRHKSPATETLSGSAVRLLWQLVQHESQLQAEISHADKLASIGSFAAGIAHDINNPLYLILGLAEDLMEQSDPAVIKEHARDIIAAVKRTSRICTDLTRYARRDRDGTTGTSDIHVKLDEALKIARYALLFQDMTVKLAYDAKHRLVRATPDDVLHMFVNLITNAIHAMDGHGVLTLSTRDRDGMVEVGIADTGSGIPPDVREHIFDAFFTTKEPGKGTGLGLYNVKTILEKIDGTIAVESEVGKGTTIHLRLPAVS
ncbi:hypothetical protein YTPLAS18_30430 [Nitrospira sp.]|nr:hypothetical protein YTPLAS18_30430 [Nitrospira sp.]